MGSNQKFSALSFAGRVVRGRRLDGNPLRRATDRVETILVTTLLVVFLAGAPLAALLAGGWAHSAAQRAERIQQATRRQVTATLLVIPASRASDGPSAVTWAGALRWVAPDGRAVSTSLAVPIEMLGNQRTLPVWSTAQGQLAPPPINGLQVGALTALCAAAAAVVAALTLFLSGLTARLVLNRHRMAAWDADWRATGPRWSTHA
jgi:hypothetical protein